MGVKFRALLECRVYVCRARGPGVACVVGGERRALFWVLLGTMGVSYIASRAIFHVGLFWQKIRLEYISEPIIAPHEHIQAPPAPH